MLHQGGAVMILTLLGSFVQAVSNTAVGRKANEVAERFVFLVDLCRKRSLDLVMNPWKARL
jgi:hypothetical protein